MLTDRQSITEEMWQFRLAFFALFFVLVVFIPISVYVIHKILEQPLRRILSAIKQVEEGELEINSGEISAISEFYQLVDTFNHMINRIRELKIENYEVLLDSQKVTMQYLALQIKPHFYANVLNMIYSLAETKDFENIQRISVTVGNYSRYMFHDVTELVELKREMGHVRAYMEMQKIRYGSQIMCTESIPDRLWDALIPPFIIQSFVENSMKYAFNTKLGCEIQVSASLDNMESNLILTIRDNGNGYPQALLDNGWKQKKEEGHIGLRNIWTRMNLIYEDGADIFLYNDDGAVSVLTIPYVAIGSEEVEDA
ncbi:MAG: histidine kinase [Lachnospiraceae bacterium]|nr:histidine kinase [Lachnospiraceae bacterium]